MLGRALLLLAMQSACAGSIANSGRDGDASASINRLVDSWHEAAANADAGTYFDLLAADAVFLGTDASERWTKTEFEKSYRRHFEAGSAWTFRATERHIRISADGNTAWFDEKLHTEKMGEGRGSGVLLRTADGWKIAHYNLTIPIPNDLLPAFVEQIQSYDSQNHVPNPVEP